MYYYTYYSYEEFGRGYIGSRQSKVPPEQDPYMGSYRDETFKPTHKIILQAYNTKEEAMTDEIKLHNFYEVDINPNFANKARARSKKFYFSDSELSRQMGCKLRDEKRGIFSLSHDQIVENAKKGAKIAVELNLGIHGMSFEERSTIGKKGAQKAKELNVGIVALTKEQLSLQGKKGGKVRGQQLVAEGFYSSEKQKERGKKGGLKTSSQRWQCIETGFITNAGNLSRYQKHRGIDTSKRIRLS